MLASLSSFLPSVLTSSQNKPAQPVPVFESTGNETDDAKSVIDDGQEISPKKQDKKDKSLAETFIFVRPPPSKSNHPLNLQVQMVPPRPRQGSVSSYHQSSDPLATPTPSHPDPPKSADTLAAPQDNSAVNLTRTNSESSAAYSGSTSVASFSSVGSTASARRTIIPLYNLQAHNVMTNTIVDAGTDAKIARFNKRGLELIGLAFLEPVEVWGPPPNINLRTDNLHAPGTENSPFLRAKRLSTSSRPLTPDTPHTPASSSALSLSSASHSHAQASPTTQAHPQTHPHLSEPLPPGTRKSPFFVKLFKKKDAVDDTTATQLNTPAHDRAPSAPSAASRMTRHFKRASLSVGSSSTTPSGSTFLQAPSAENNVDSIAFPSGRQSTSEPTPLSSTSPSNAPVSSSAAAAAAVLRPAVLGIQPTFSSPVNPPVGRPSLYVWVVRRWLKGAETGILGGVIGRIGASAAIAAGKMSGGGSGSGSGHADASAMNGSGTVSVGADIEVRFEWKRGRSFRRKRRGRKDGGSIGVEDLSGSTSAHQDSPRREGTSQKRASRISMSSLVSEDGNLVRFKRPVDEEGDGEDSDPEDSETPWTCTLKVRRVGEPPTNGGDQVQAMRVKVGTLSQTPHHPKVVAMLKVPYPLPDVGVEIMEARKRVPGGVRSFVGPKDGLMLTAEEIKDVVSSTGLWLVVREGFGGVGKVTRKGDGWRIRA